MSSEPLAFSFDPLWVQTLQAPASGLSLAREKGWLLTWDRNHWLYLFNDAGRIQGQVHVEQELAEACITEDASAILVAGKGGLLRLLGQDLTVRWERRLKEPIVAAALEPFGRSLIICDSNGVVTLFSAEGLPLWTIVSPKPLIHLKFIPGRRQVVASADFGLTGSLDHKGDWVWKDAPITNVGDLCITGDGTTLLLACYSEGLHRYGINGDSLGRLPTTQPWRHVAQSYLGDRILVAGLTPELALLNRDGTTLARLALERPVAGLALDALGDAAIACLTDGAIKKWKITSKRSPNRDRALGSSVT